MSSSDLLDTTDFIKATVNPQMDQNLDRWLPNQPITICDGTSCILLTFQVGCSCWLPVAPTFRDSGQGYKNGQITKKTGQNGDTGVPIGAFYVYVSTFHYYNTTQQIITPRVIVSQGNQSPAGFGSDFAGGFAWGGGNSSYSYGGDGLAGGGDLYAADFGGGSKACSPPCTVMER